MPRIQIDVEAVGTVNVYMIPQVLTLLELRQINIEELLSGCYQNLKGRYLTNHQDPPRNIGLLPLLSFGPTELRDEVLAIYRANMSATINKRDYKPNRPRKRLL